MIQLSVKKNCCGNAVKWEIYPKKTCLGAQDANGVENISVSLPEEWEGYTVRVTFLPFRKEPIAVILTPERIIQVTRDITAAQHGQIVMDAIKDEQVTYSTGANYETYSHPIAGGKEPGYTPDEYQQFVQQIEAAAQKAYGSAESAGQDATQAKTAADNANQDAKNATRAALDAGSAANAAGSAAEKAESSAQLAEQAVQKIGTSAEDAKNAAQAAQKSAESAGKSQTAAESAARNAAASEINAGASAVEAKKSETAAGQSASSAQQSASGANQSAISASQSALTATQQAGTASTSASAAQQAQKGAEAAQRAAESAKTQAVESADNADKSAQAAAQSEQNAEKSAKSAAELANKIPTPTAENAGKALIVNPDGTGYQFGSSGAEIDDTKIQKSTTWSSQKIIDTLAPAFEVSGPIAACNPIEGYPLSAVASIEPLQEGEGDPSADNVRPIKGWDSVNIWRSGANLCEKVQKGYYNNTDFSLNEINSERLRSFKIYLPKGKYIVSFSEFVNIVRCFTQYNNTSFITALISDAINVNNAQVELMKNTVLYVSFRLTSNENWGSNTVQLEFNSAVTPYEPYRGEAFAVDFGQTVYGGILDLATGALAITKSGIASYNGEILPGAWISDRDVYSEGVQPTTGAQVVYDLDQPQLIQLTPQQIAAFSGTNTVYADTGDVTVSGRADPTATINKLISEIARLKNAQAEFQAVQNAGLGL